MQPCDPRQKDTKTYNSGYSLVVTHLTTNPPVRCLNRAERTGSLVFNVLWSYVPDWLLPMCYIVVIDVQMGSDHSSRPFGDLEAPALNHIGC
jgi:hypothetical protein